MTDPDPVPRRSRKAELIRWAIGLTIGAMAVWVAFGVAGGLAGASEALGQLNGWWLVPAFGIEAVSYVVLGLKLRRLIGPGTVSSVEGIELGLVVSGFGLLTPASPAEGLALAVAHLRRRGLSRRRITMVFGFSEWFSTRVFLLVSSFNLLAVVLIERDPFSDLWPLVLIAVLVIGALAVTARMAARPGAVAWVSQVAGSLRRPSRRRPIEDRRASGVAWHQEAKAFVGPPRQRVVLALLTAGASLADVACLWFALIAAGAHVGFDIALLAMTVASFATLVPLVPGGIGIVETALPAVTHHFGVPYEQGLAAALAYRGLGTFMPAGVGALAIFGLRSTSHRSTS